MVEEGDEAQTGGSRRDPRARRRVRRRLGRAAARVARRDDRQPRQLHAVHADAAGNGLGNARASPRRRPAADDVPARRPRPRPSRRSRRGAHGGHRRDRRRRAGDRVSQPRASRSAPCRARSRSPASPSTPSVSRRSPTRSTSAITCCASSRPPTPSRTPSRVAAHLGYVFVGGGYAGVEALAELNDLVRDAMRYYPRLRAVRQRWVLVDAAPRILAEIPTRLGEYAARQLERRGVEIRHSTRLQSAGHDSSCFPTASGSRHATLVWTAGVRASPLLAQLGLPLDERGRVLVDEYLRVSGREAVWALGDCAAVPNRATPDERIHPRPSTPCDRRAAWHATSLRRTRAGTLKPYRYRMLGQAADARPPQGHRRRPRPQAVRLPRLVLDTHVPPHAAPAHVSEAQSRRRLDSGALLPPRHRRARDARPSRVASRALTAIPRPRGAPSRATGRRRARRRRDPRGARRARAPSPS